MEPSLLCIIFDCHPLWPSEASSSTTTEEHGRKKSRGADGTSSFDASAAVSTSPPKINLNQVLKHTAVFINAFWLCNRNNKLIAVTNCREKAEVCFPAFHSMRQNSRTSQADHKQDYVNAFDINANTHKIVAEQFLAHCTTPSCAGSSSSSSNSSSNSSSSPVNSEGGTSTAANAVSLSLCIINKLIKTCKTAKPRILIIQSSPDYSHSYNPLMNAVFSADKLDIPIDTIVLSNEPSTLMQQASYVTGGIHFHLPQTVLGGQADVLLQKLMTYILPSKLPRHTVGVPRELISTSSAPHQMEIDFRAACSCHLEKKDIVNMCSVCLSLFCEPTSKCLVCGTPVNNK